MKNMRDLHDAVVEGAVQRIRPKIMTVCAILFGLLPIMWSASTQTGADVMKRIATPMIGGVVTSAVLELLLYPVIYVIWRRRELQDRDEEEAAFAPPTLVLSEGVRRRLSRIIATILIAAALIYAANFARHKFANRNVTTTPVATQTVNDLTVKVMSPGGQLRQGDNNVVIEFRDSSGRPVDVGPVKFELNMNMPGMQMQGGGAAQSTGVPGQYRVKVKADMVGDWNAKISYDGPRGKGETHFSLNIK